MRILDVETDKPVIEAQLYFSPKEARELVASLIALLDDEEASEHAHIISDGCEISFSLITPAKLKRIEGYTKREQLLLTKNS